MAEEKEIRMTRQIIIDVNSTNAVITTNEMASIFETVAVLQAILGSLIKK